MHGAKDLHQSTCPSGHCFVCSILTVLLPVIRGLFNKFLVLCTLLLATTLCAMDVAYSPPVGGMNITINGGTPSTPISTSFAIPIWDVPAAAGASQGAITSVTATTITVAGAGWTTGGLALPGFPYNVRIASGPAEGRTFGITGNTADTLTVATSDLIALGVAAGQGVKLIPVDTLNSLFGSNTFMGGPNPASADIITLSSSIELSYYYNTSVSPNRWVRTTGATTDRGNTPIPTDSVITVTRKGPVLPLTFVGRVPDTRVNMPVANSGSTYTHTGFPIPVSLGTLALQNRIGGWVSSSSASSADILAVSSGGTWLYYFHNGSFWQRTTGPASNRDSIEIPAGGAIHLFKRGSALGSSFFVRQRPF